jgi:guanylate kinase
MAAKVMTSIYLTPLQKQALSRRAKRRRATVSEEIRTALDRHLERDDDSELQLGLLAAQANMALARMIDKLDEAHTAVSRLKRSLAGRKR